MSNTEIQRVSIVIPVFRGEKTLPTLIQEVAPLTEVQSTPGGRRFVICEVLLVHDCGPDRSDKAIEALSAQYSFVQPIWLSRNYGQHPATLAGMASATGDWVVSIDEDGQQDPVDIGLMLDCACNWSTRSQAIHHRTVGSEIPLALRPRRSVRACWAMPRLVASTVSA
jgi:polyisoprenyl-phosphate glycosyltransferase